jgi:fido (protein-threonine AMPylation protein)
VARKNIEGEISVDESCNLIRTYYEDKMRRNVPVSQDEEEADKVSAHIARILSTRSFAFTTEGFISVHRRIFEGVFKHAGQLRDFDIAKKEWVLEGDTVNYLNWQDLRRAIDYDLQQERDFSYAGMEMPETVRHLARFVSGLWQIHPFREGNTRTTAVFLIQYLRHIGFKVNNDLFASDSWYFRNALVRANYKNVRLGIDYTPDYLVHFFENLLMGQKWELKNRYLHIHPTEEWRVQPNLTEQVREDDRSSTDQVPIKFTDQVGDGILALLKTLGEESLSIKEMMDRMGLRHRPSFVKNYLQPAINQGLIERIYPDKPNHPRQKYRLSDSAKIK